jgi:division protein CdvB (Snf7/Vps24/ESCRT-III family)
MCLEITTMSKFEKNWKPAASSGSFGQKTKETIRGPQPLKPQIQKATGQLNQEIHRLDGALNRMKQRETAIFKKTVAAVQQHDEATSKAYSNELAEVKKMTKIVTQSKIALEQITMRLQTVTEFGDFTAVLAPAIGVIKNVRTSLATALPDAQGALGDIGTELSTMMTDVGGLTGANFFMGSETNEESEKIMAEAAAVAEKRMGDSFPEVPSAQDESVFSSGS